ncbi:MAG: hypothetical protein AB8C02_12970 [Halioglobus sp.]
MSTRSKLWVFSALLYAAFFAWYTDFGGPLTDAEVDEFIATMKADGGSIETIAFIEQFARQDTGRQFLMVNNIDYNENPGKVEGAEAGESAQQLIGRYMQHMLPALLSRASHPVVMGKVVYASVDVVGIEGAETWDDGALFRYRSRRSFMEIVSNPEFKGQHHFKTAALEKTIAYPIEPSLYLGDLRLLLGLVMLSLVALVDGWLLSRRLPPR